MKTVVIRNIINEHQHSVRIVIRLRVELPRYRGSIPGKGKEVFLFFIASRETRIAQSVLCVSTHPVSEEHPLCMPTAHTHTRACAKLLLSDVFSDLHKQPSSGPTVLILFLPPIGSFCPLDRSDENWRTVLQFSLTRLILRSWRWKRNVPPKLRLCFYTALYHTRQNSS
jgi:hypothetical protein